jgi:hypothetical protein
MHKRGWNGLLRSQPGWLALEIIHNSVGFSSGIPFRMVTEFPTSIHI